MSLRPRDDPLGIELVSGSLLVVWRIRFSVPLPLLLEVASQPLPPTLLGLQLGRELIPARLPVTLILRLVVAIVSAMISRAIRSKSTFESRLALACNFVPSTATTPDLTNPARSQSSNTAVNSSPSARSCRQMNLAIVA